MPPPKQTIIEDDVDDLDGEFKPHIVEAVILIIWPLDVLDQFNAPSSTKETPVPKQEPEVEIDDEEFAKHFAAEMELFLNNISAAPTDSKLDESLSADEFRKQWEKLIIGDLEGNEAPPTAHSTSLPSTSGHAEKQSSAELEEEFQNLVKQTMEKLKESDDTIKVGFPNKHWIQLLTPSYRLMNRTMISQIFYLPLQI